MFLFVFVFYHVTFWMGSNKLNWTELNDRIINGVTRPVNDATAVQKLKATDQLSGVEPGSVVRELLVLLNVKHEVATVQVFHHEEQVSLSHKKPAAIRDLKHPSTTVLPPVQKANTTYNNCS